MQESSQFAQEQDAKIAEEQAQLAEDEEKAREDALVELLGNVDLNDPVIVEDASGRDVAIRKQQFIDFYLPEGISQLEAFHCFQQVRVSGLNPLIKGQCHFFKTGEGSVSLFTGYEVYLARAYKNGMEHMEEPVWEIGDDGLPISCTLTIHIEGRPDFTRTTRYAEVVGVLNDKPNKRWKRAPFQMTEKCTIVNTLRLAGIAAVDDLPYAVEEMGEPVIAGQRTLTHEQTEGHNLPKQENAEPGPVTATTHQIDLSPLHKIYRGKLTEREIFPDDTTRKMWQSEIIGKASTGDWDAADFNNSTAEIESGRCEQWVQENQPKPDPPSPGGNDPTEQNEHGWADQAAMEVGNVNGHLPLDDDADPEPPAKPKTEEATGGDKFLEGLPDNPEEHAEPEETIQERLFLAEASTRFVTPRDRDAWCLALFLPPVPREKWSGTEYAQATKAMFVLPKIAAQNDTGDAGQGSTQGEPEKEQEQDTTPMSKATGAAIRQVLDDFGDRRYQTVKSLAFRDRAGEALKAEQISSISDLTEGQGLTVLNSLTLERQEQLAKIEEAEKFKTDLEAGEVVDDDPLNQGEPEEQEPPEDTEAWLNSPEFAEQLNAYMIRAAGRFPDVIKSTAWHQEIGLNGAPRFWEQGDFDQANAALGELDLADTTKSNEPTPPEEPTAGDEKCTDEQYKKMEALFSELIPGHTHAMGTEEARDLIYAVTGNRYKYLNTITQSDISDVILELEDRIGEMEADAEAR